MTAAKEKWDELATLLAEVELGNRLLLEDPFLMADFRKMRDALSLERASR